MCLDTCWLRRHAPAKVMTMVDNRDTAFRDGGVGSGANRRKPTDEAPRGGSRGGRGARGRGGEFSLSGSVYPYSTIVMLTG